MAKYINPPGDGKPNAKARRPMTPSVFGTADLLPRYTDEEREFLAAMDRYKTMNRRPFPSWHEVLMVVKSLGYRRVEEPTPLPGFPTANDLRRRP